MEKHECYWKFDWCQFVHVVNRRSNSTHVCSSQNDFRVSSQEPTNHSFAKFIVILRYFTLSQRRSHYHEISWYCHRVAHISRASYTRARLCATLRPHDPTYLYFLTVLHAHLPLRKRTIRGTIRSNFIC